MVRLASFIFAALLLPAAAAAQNDQQTLRLGYPQTPVGAIAVIADSVDVWSRNGLNVESTAFAAAINARDAVVAERIDVGVTGLSNFLVGAVEADLAALGVALDQCAATTIMVRPDSDIDNVAELRGRKVAAQTGTVTHGAFINRVSPAANLQASDMQMVNLRFRDMVSALSAGSVDAITAVDPYLSNAEHAGLGKVVTDFCPYARVPLILAASQNWIADHPETVKKFLSSWRDAVRFIKAEPKRATEIYAQSLKARGYELPTEVVAKIISRLNVDENTLLFSEDFLTYVRDEVAAMLESGQIAQKVDFDEAFPKQPALN